MIAGRLFVERYHSRGVDRLGQRFRNILWKLRILGHVNRSDLQGFVLVKWQIVQSIVSFSSFKIRQDQPAFSCFVSATRSTKSVNIGITILRETDLDDMADVGKIHAARRHIRRNHDRRVSPAECFSSKSAFPLGKAGVYVDDPSWM